MIILVVHGQLLTIPNLVGYLENHESAESAGAILKGLIELSLHEAERCETFHSDFNFAKSHLYPLCKRNNDMRLCSFLDPLLEKIEQKKEKKQEKQQNK